MNRFISFDPKTVPVSDLYSQVVGMVSPRPIAFVATTNQDGSINLAPFSFFMVASVDPLVLMVVPLNPRGDKKEKDTLVNIRENRTCVIHPVTEDNKDIVNLCSADLPHGESEVEYLNKLGHELEFEICEETGSKRISNAPFGFECKLANPVDGSSITSFGDNPMAGKVIFLGVVKIHVSSDFLNPEGVLQPEKLHLLGRAFGPFWVHSKLFEMSNERKPR